MHESSLGRVELIPSLTFSDFKRAVEDRTDEAVNAVLSFFDACDEGNRFYQQQHKSKYLAEETVQSNDFRCAFRITYGEDWQRDKPKLSRYAPESARGRSRIENTPLPTRTPKGTSLPYQNCGTYAVVVKGKTQHRGYWPFHLRSVRYHHPLPPFDMNVDTRDRTLQPSGKSLTPTTQVGFQGMYPSVFCRLRGELTFDKKSGTRLIKN